jgi:hypothetical protein
VGLSAVDTLFDEFAAAHARGERPEVGDYLGRAGDDADELGRLIDRYLQSVPAQPPDESTIVLVQARLDRKDPLVVARVRLGLRRSELSERLREALGLGEQLRGRVEAAYSDLERGQLDPDRVDGRVWDALRKLLGLDALRLARSTGEAAASTPFYRMPSLRAAGAPAPAMVDAEAEPVRDEVDRLFGTK